ncbi:hypothetical protein AK812_SmicGene48241, partial [Symbiodinium microadriaticum]
MDGCSSAATLRCTFRPPRRELPVKRPTAPLLAPFAAAE